MLSANDQSDIDDPLVSDDRGAVERLWLRMLTRNLWLISALIGAVMFIASVSFDLVLLKHQETPLAIVASNGLVALLAATLVFTLLVYGREQRRRIMERMEALNEVNHHVRNALQSLAFTAGALKGSKEGATILAAIQRIQFALHEVLPKVEPTYEPFQGSARGAAQQKVLAKDRRAQ